MGRNRKMAVLLVVAIFMAAPAFASTTIKAEGFEPLDLKFLNHAINLIVGIFAGGFVLIKAALDIFHAVRNSSEDQNALKKAIGNLVLNVAILGGFFFILNYMFGAYDKKGEVAPLVGGQNDFMHVLSGAEVLQEYMLGL